jgi:hypothetical protein
MKKSDKKLAITEQEKLFTVLQTRFQKNPSRHPKLKWEDVESNLSAASAEKLWSLNEMERTGGEPDLIGLDKKNNHFIFCDCSAESPAGRRSLCYDANALATRKENKPKDSAMNMAATMGIDILNEEQYRRLQETEAFDLKTSSWILTPSPIRKLGGAFFCDRRYDQVFTYHNGAESYYAARGFRGILVL